MGRSISRATRSTRSGSRQIKLSASASKEALILAPVTGDTAPAPPPLPAKPLRTRDFLAPQGLACALPAPNCAPRERSRGRLRARLPPSRLRPVPAPMVRSPMVRSPKNSNAAAGAGAGAAGRSDPASAAGAASGSAGVAIAAATAGRGKGSSTGSSARGGARNIGVRKFSGAIFNRVSEKLARRGVSDTTQALAGSFAGSGAVASASEGRKAKGSAGPAEARTLAATAPPAGAADAASVSATDASAVERRARAKNAAKNAWARIPAASAAAVSTSQGRAAQAVPWRQAPAVWRRQAAPPRWRTQRMRREPERRLRRGPDDDQGRERRPTAIRSSLPPRELHAGAELAAGAEALAAGALAAGSEALAAGSEALAAARARRLNGSASSSEIIRRIEARISSIEGSCAFCSAS